MYFFRFYLNDIAHYYFCFSLRWYESTTKKVIGDLIVLGHSLPREKNILIKVSKKNINFRSQSPWLLCSKAPYFGSKSPFWTPNFLPYIKNGLNFAQIMLIWPKLMFGYKAALLWITKWVSLIFQPKSNSCYGQLILLVDAPFLTHFF